MEDVAEYSGVTTIDGKKILSYEFIETLRAADKKLPNPQKIISQRGGQEKFLSTMADICIYGGKRGGAKAQPYSSKVITPFGERDMGSLKVGSIISDTDGNMQKVISISEHGFKPVYEILFKDGTTARCTDDHLWKIKRTNYIRKSRRINGTGQEADWQNWTFEMVREFLDKRNSGEIKSGNLLIPLCAPVKFTKPINRYSYKPKTHPYIIGAILGDGCISESQRIVYTASITSADKEVISNVKAFGITEFIECYKEGTNAIDYKIKNKSLDSDLLSMGLAGRKSNDKFIPEYYKTASIEERFYLVQGLMDTDGTIDQRGHCSYSTISETLAGDMAYILRSLGAYVTIEKSKAGYRKGEEYIQCNPVYNLYIKIEDTARLFTLPRKKERARKFNGGVSTPCKAIESYKFVGYDKCRCIAVSNPNSLYITDNFNVTHNSFSLLLEAQHDIENKYFNAIIFRNEINDLTDLITTSYRIYNDFGKYNKSKGDMTWNFNKGGWLEFNYYSDGIEDFKKRFQGHQYAYMGADEITHMDYPKFKYLITCNRNAHFIRNRFFGTCNPDPDSWVATFIKWWIDEDGYPIPERDGVIRYCFMDGDSIDGVYWGNTREEVYEQCKQIIDRLWKPEYDSLGTPQDLFIKSVTFIEGKLEENMQLLRSDPTYLANLANQSEEQRARDLEGNWKFRTAGTGLVTMEHMNSFFTNALQTETKTRYMTCDPAFTGGDNCVFWIWEGWNIIGIHVCKKDSKKTIETAKFLLEQHKVLEDNFAYDLNGLGQIFVGFFPRAVKFNNIERPSDGSHAMFDYLKSEVAYKFIVRFTSGGVSINPDLLNRKYSGKGFKDLPLSQVLMNERQVMRQDETASDRHWKLITKSEMKKLIGHSPDFWESMMTREIFEIKTKRKRIKGLGLL